MKQMRRACAAGLFAGAMLTGCAVGPDFHEPSAPATGTYTETPLPPVTVAAPGTTGRRSAADPPRRRPPRPVVDAVPLRTARPPGPRRRSRTARRSRPRRRRCARRRRTYAPSAGALLFPSVDANVSARRARRSPARRSASRTRRLGHLQSLQCLGERLVHARHLRRQPARARGAAVRRSTTRASSSKAPISRSPSNIVTTAIQEASLRAQIAGDAGDHRRRRRSSSISSSSSSQLGAVRRARRARAAARSSRRRARRCRRWRSELAQTRHLLAVLAGRLPERRGAAGVRARRL